MERRNFIHLSVTGIGASIVAPISLAETAQSTAVVSDIYYTKNSTGRWSGKEAAHLPIIEIDRKDGKISVKVLTAHEMKGYEHYIIKHVLLDKYYKFLAEHMFNPLEDKVVTSVFLLENYSGAIYALSLCNKHDLWLNGATV